MIVKLLTKVDNFDLLTNEVITLVNKLKSEKNQISCQTTEEETGNWFESVGSLYDLPEKEEIKYCHIHPDLKGSQIEKQIMKYNGFRSRIMIVNPKTCYSVHKDPSPRIHIPIVTDEQSWMVWPKDNFCYNLRPGFVYWTDTRKMHSFFNGSIETQRIHLVLNVSNNI